MSRQHDITTKHIMNFPRGRSVNEIVEQMKPDLNSPPTKIPVSAKTTLERIKKKAAHPKS
jgi:hypothetical protein